MTQLSRNIELVSDEKSLAEPWPNVPLPDLLSLIVDNRGRTVPATSSGIPLIATDCIKEDALYPVRQNLRYVSKETYETWFRGHPEPGDVILVNKGTPGRVCQVPAPVDFCIAQDMVSLRPKPGVVDSDYLLAALRSPNFKEQVEGLHVGMVIPHLKKADFPHLQIPLPPLSIQQPIGRIYCDLSRKIESNRQIGRTLEELSAALFRSWFVDFDPVVAKAAGRQPAYVRPDLAALFPATFQDSPLGPIPHGWRTRPVTEVVEFNPIRRLAKGKPAPYLDMQNVPTDSALPANWAIRSHGSGMKFQNGDTLMARITPCLENGKTAFVNALADDEVGWGSTEFIVMRPLAPLPLEYGYFLARSDDFRAHAIANMTGSSGRQRVAANCFEQFLVTEPPKEIAAAFGNIVAPFMRTMKANVEESRTLAALRDTLLPKLLSGELRVKQVKKLVEANL